MAFVVIQHLAPTHPSSLVDVLGQTTRMPVIEAVHGTSLVPNHVYVIPPDTHLTLRGGVLEVLARTSEPRCPYLPVDVFFRSLADARKTTAIGVVLSGSAGDGTEGLTAIKAQGGITLAQAPESAKYPMMPQSAIAAGAVDRVLSVEALAAELGRLARHPYVRFEPPGPEAQELPEAEDTIVGAICKLLRVRTGVDFGGYKRNTIRRRLARRMTLGKRERLADYLTLLQADPSELRALSEDLLIRVTGFFRDPAMFAALAHQVLPEILEHKLKDETELRVWIPGCSTGEEVYSIAITVAEVLGEAMRRGSIQIFGSDISEAAIDRARSGVYPDAIAADVTEAQLRRFFTKVDGGYRISKGIRDLCVFVKHDVTRDPPFTRLDLISCRNLLIYFSAELQKKVIPLLHHALNDPGFLVLGRTETIGFPHLFALEDHANKIYRRKPALAKLVVAFPAAFPRTVHPGAVPPKPREAALALSDLRREADRVLQARYGPAAVVVNEALDIVCTRGRTGPYLELPSGEAKLNVLAMAREGLLYDIRLALHRARKEDAFVRRDAAHVRVDGRSRSVHIEVSPLSLAPATRERYFLVVFRDVAVVPDDHAATAGRRRKPARREPSSELQIVQKLRDELDATKDYLQSVIEEHSVTNEELASTNEELLSSNEELQSTNEELETAKEELQSANEELSTVNNELHSRNAELSQSNSDLFNVMSSIEVPIVLVGPDRRIRRFTPRAADQMNLIASDVGRPIREINLDVGIEELDRSIARVIETMEVEEAEVRDRTGRWFRLQIRPYMTANHQIDGAVVSLVDIDAPKRALAERDRLLETIRHERGFLEAVVQQMPAGVIIAEAPSGKLLLANQRITEILGQPLVPFASLAELGAVRGLHSDGRPYKPEEWPLARSIRHGEVVAGEQIVLQRQDGSYATVLASSAPILIGDGKTFGGVVALVDLSREIEARVRTDREQKLLGDTAAFLSDGLDLDKTLQTTVQLVVPHIADWCIVDLKEGDKPLRQAAVAHADPEKEMRARELARRLPPDPQLEHGIGYVLRTRKPEIYPLVTDLAWVANALSVAHPAILRELGARSYICVPLIAREQVMGVLSLIRGPASERYDEQSLRLAEQLGQRFAIAIDNARLYRTALDAVRLRNEFFSIAAHELRTPMSALLGQIQGMRLLAERNQLAPDDAQWKSLAVAERQVRRLDQLVNTLLDVSQIASGRFALQRDDVDFAAVVQEVTARFEEQARRAGCVLEVRADGPVQGSWDRLRLEQVVTNLLTNALKYGAGKPIEVRVDSDDTTVRLAVRDHGIGIAAEDLERIFGQFERAVPAKHYAGLGMGLFITRQIVEAHGGTVRASSEPGKGSTFTAELPRRASTDDNLTPATRRV